MKPWEEYAKKEPAHPWMEYQQKGDEQASDTVTLNLDAPKQEAPDRGTAQNLARAVGLSARAPLDAAGDLLSIPGNAITTAYNMATGRNVPMPSQTYNQWISSALPTPETPVEKFSNKVARTGYSIMGPSAIAGATKPTTEVGKGVAEQLAARPGMQVIGGTSAAGADDLMGQYGVPAWARVPLSLGVGIAAPKLASVAEGAGKSAFQRVMGAVKPEQASHRIDVLIEQSGFDPRQIGVGVKNELGRMVSEAQRLGRDLSPDAIKNLLTLRAAGVSPANITRAMVSRDQSQWKQEERLRDIEDIGQPILDRYLGADRDIVESLKRISPDQLDDPSTGRAIVSGVKSVAGGLKMNADSAYQAARNSPELKDGVPINDLRQWLNSTMSEWIVKPEYKAALAKLRRLSSGMPKMTVENYEKLRQFANGLANSSDPRSVGAVKDIISKIDDTLLSAGKSGVFEDARFANSVYKSTVSDQGIIDDLLAMKSRTDRAINYEDVFKKSVLSSGVDQLKQVVNTLRVGGESGAIETLRAKTIEHLVNALGPKGGGDGSFRPATFRSAIDSIKDKLPVLFSPDEVRAIEAAHRASQLVMQQPSRTYGTGSKTAGEITNMLLRLTNSSIGRTVNKWTLNAPAALGQGLENASKRAAVSQSLTGNPLLAPAIPMLNGTQPLYPAIIYGAGNALREHQ